MPELLSSLFSHLNFQEVKDMRKFIVRIMIVMVILSMALSTAGANGLTAAASDVPSAPTRNSAEYSHRIIVELKSPSLAEAAKTDSSLKMADGSLNMESAAASQYISQLKAEQAAFVSAMRSAVPEATVSNYINELGAAVQLSYVVVFNGLTIDPGV